MENELFDEMYKVETRHWWFVSRRKIIAAVIDSLKLGNSLKVMDAGCGNGDNLEFLSNYGELVAVERDTNALARAQMRKSGRVFKGALPDELPEEITKNNDLIVLLDVLEHIEDDAKSLFVLRGWAKQKGNIVITVPAYQFLWTRHDDIHHHKRRYTVTSLKQVVENNGWKIQYISYFNTFLFPLALINRLVKKVFPPSADDGMDMPNRYINDLFKKIFGFESNIISKFNFPFGLSIIAVAEKI